MDKRIAALSVSFFLLATVTDSQTPSENSLVERVGDTGFVRVKVESFGSLTAKQRQLAYWLSQASIAVDPIAYDQFSRFGLRQKRLLEEVVAHAHADAAGPGVKAKIVEFTKLFWANRGNHNGTTSQKFLPDFTFEELKQAAFVSQKNGAFATPCADLPPSGTRGFRPDLRSGYPTHQALSYHFLSVTLFMPPPPDRICRTEAGGS